MLKQKFKGAIIGAGPSGIACAIQLKRYNIDFALFEKNEIGGLLRNANLVENYPGFPNGITGAKLVKLFKKQIENNRIKVIKENVEVVDYKNNAFEIKTTNKNYRAEILIIASGTKPKELPLSIPKHTQHRIFYEIINLINLKNKSIGIIGSGDAAFDYALSLSKNNKIYILNRKKKAKSLPILFRRCKKNKNIRYFGLFDIGRIEYKDKKLILYSRNKRAIVIDYLVVAIGREPNLDFLGNNIRKKQKALEKNKKLYIIGDVKNGIFRQTAIGIGDGIRTAMEVYFNQR